MNPGDDPEANMTWTAVGYDAQARTYPQQQRWPNVLATDSRVRAERVLSGINKMFTLQMIQQSHMAQQLMGQLQALLAAYAAGDLLHGPMLAYCYITGNTFYTHVEHGNSFLMPKLRLEQAGTEYDCYEHVAVALTGIEKLVRAFRCQDVQAVDVSQSSALKRQAVSYVDANKAKVARFFVRCHTEQPLIGFQVSYLDETFMAQREYQFHADDSLPRHESQFFMDDDEAVSFYATGKWQFFWAFSRDERGGLLLWKISGHSCWDGTFAAKPRPERRRVTFGTFDGGAAGSHNLSHSAMKRRVCVLCVCWALHRALGVSRGRVKKGEKEIHTHTHKMHHVAGEIGRPSRASTCRTTVA
jgi:hypothetical protein